MEMTAEEAKVETYFHLYTITSFLNNYASQTRKDIKFHLDTDSECT